MRIELANVERSKEFAHVYGGGELVLQEQRLRLVGLPAVSGEVRLDSAAVIVNGKVAAVLEVECDRCLNFVEFPVDAAFKVQYVPPEHESSKLAVELTEDDLDLAVFDGDAVDIDELVAEELQLAVPAHVLCREDCKGLCPVCGVNRNMVECGCQSAEVDPRWAGLKKLVNSE